MDYIQEAKNLVKNLNQRMNPSPYDIGWMARLKDDGGGPRWPYLIDWLIENQKSDGSWGGEIEYYHDRIICSLIAIIALKENGHSLEAQQAIKRGEHYVWNHLHLLRRDPFELAGFELIIPTLLLEAQGLGLDVPLHTCGYGEIQTAKLRLIPSDMLYSPYISTVYSLEFLGRDGDVSQIQKAKTAIGSIGNSPATTAYYLGLCQSQDKQALDYLETVAKHDQGTITVYPFKIFELVWVLNNFLYTGLPVTEFITQDQLLALREQIGARGVGFDETFTVTDGDTTSVTYRVLASAGLEPDPKGLLYFENKEKGVFRTWDYERNVSVSANAHALEALHLMPDYPNAAHIKEKVIVSLLGNQILNMYWTDKWHASPYYATAHALIAMIKEKPFLAYTSHHTRDWIVHTQQADGSWGFFGPGTPEETAYAMMLLFQFNQHEPIDRDVFHRGAEYLMKEYSRPKSIYPDLWIAKCLYGPDEVVRSAILATIIMYCANFI